MYDNDDKVTKSVADAVRKIMEGSQPEVLSEELKGKQHKIDKNKNGKIDAHDFKLLRKEEQELEEGKMGQLSADLTDLSHSEFHKQYGKPKSHYDSTNFKKPVQKGKEMDRAKSLAQRGMASMKQEEVEELDEISTRTLARAAGAAADPDSDYAYGKSHDPQKFADHAKKTKDAKSAAAVQGAANAKGSYSRPGHTYGYDKLDRDMRSTNPSMVTKAGKLSKTSVKGLKSSLRKESFTDLLNTYTEGGIKSLLESLKYNKIVIEEESTNDEFTAEIKKAQDKSQGKDKAKVAEPKVDAVEDVSEEVEKHTFVAVHAKKGMHQTQGSTSYEAAKNAAAHWKMKSTAGIDVHRADKTHVAEELDQIEERELSDTEMDKREKYVKGMKKGLQGFKQRYGDKGEEVMYATATKMAKKD